MKYLVNTDFCNFPNLSQVSTLSLRLEQGTFKIHTHSDQCILAKAQKYGLHFSLMTDSFQIANTFKSKFPYAYNIHDGHIEISNLLGL